MILYEDTGQDNKRTDASAGKGDALHIWINMSYRRTGKRVGLTAAIRREAPRWSWREEGVVTLDRRVFLIFGNVCTVSGDGIYHLVTLSTSGAALCDEMRIISILSQSQNHRTMNRRQWRRLLTITQKWKEMVQYYTFFMIKHHTVKVSYLQHFAYTWNTDINS